MPTRRVFAITILVIGAVVGMTGLTGTAHAAAYRYWTYWQGGTGTWAFATAGPASAIPSDGSVEGWRFAVTTTAGQAADQPTVAPSFDEICGATAPVDDHKRVALVIDPGPAGIAPDGQTPPAATSACVVAETDANGYDVLRSVASVRTDGGLICAIEEYPAGECAPVVDDPLPPSASAATTAIQPTESVPGQPSSQSSSGVPWVTVAVIALVTGIGLVLWRRRRHD